MQYHLQILQSVLHVQNHYLCSDFVFLYCISYTQLALHTNGDKPGIYFNNLFHKQKSMFQCTHTPTYRQDVTNNEYNSIICSCIDDDVLIHSIVIIDVLLAFRKLCLQVLKVVFKRRIPFMFFSILDFKCNIIYKYSRVCYMYMYIYYMYMYKLLIL